MKLKCCCLTRKKDKLKNAVNFLKVVSDENRLHILRILRTRELSVGEMWHYLDLSQNLVSHHLRVLKDFGLVDSKKTGLKVIYSINSINIKRHKNLLVKFI